MEQPTFAVVDIGSNTVHLLVARSDGAAVTAIADVSMGLGLGSEVERTGEIGPALQMLLLDALRALQSAATVAGVGQVHLVATEAVRAAANGAAVCAAIAAATGLAVTVLHPDQEARFAYQGATLAATGAGAHVVVDFGGGSVQVVVGEGQTMRDSVSLPLGGARLVARFLPGDPPSAEAEARLAAHLAAVMPGALPPAPGALSGLIGVGGALRRLPGLLGASLDRPLPADALEQAAQKLRGRSAEELVAQYGLEPDRIHLLRPAILVLQEVARTYGSPPLTISAYGLREGLVLALARHESITGGDGP